ncbi:YwqG family protein [Bernardetia sp. OM2101]|uniref:YwqG family protein n=1 Tax=Bernardetia sp. OM2101 TaxID=3344876 RepID=UPI0035D099F5
MKKLLIFFILFLGISCTPKTTNSSMKTDELKSYYEKELTELEWDSTDIDYIKSFLKPAINISFEKSKSIGLGKSKFGGTPDLPKDIEWARFEGKPMIFLAQINLSELKEYDLNNELPKTGILYFFIHFKEPENQFGAEYNFIFDKQEYSVLYSENENLEKTDFPSDLISLYHFNEVALNFSNIYTFPSYETLEAESINEKDRENFYTFNEMHGNNEGEQILGYTMPIQSDVTGDWAFSYLNLTSWDLSEQDKKKIDNIRPKFVTLLQFSLENDITGFNKIGISIGYFGITKEDLKNKNFKNSILVLQDT